MEKNVLSKRKLILLGILVLLLTGAALFFSTPWLGDAAPDYIPMPGISLELKANSSHFMRTLDVTVYNIDGRPTQECSPGPVLEYYDNGAWRQLRHPFFAPTLYTLAYLELIDRGESKSLSSPLSVYGFFLRSGHYRAVISLPLAWDDHPQVWEAAFVEFDI